MMTIQNKKQFITYVGLIAAIIIILNIVSRTLFIRFDLTDTGMYSLSNSSKAVVRQLEDRLVAKVFYSGDLPGAVANSKRYLQDLLEEYQAYSGGNLRFEFINPDNDPKAQEQARYYSIYPVQMQAIENEKMVIKNVFMGIAFIYKDKKESLPMIQSTEGLEYDLTATIKKVTATGLKTIGMVSEQNEEMSTENLTKFLSKVYQVRSVNLKSPVPADVDILLMNGATDTLTKDELYHLDQFIMSGKKLFIGQGRVRDMLQQGFAMTIRSNVFSLLEHYGVKIGEDLIIDQKCSQVQVQSQQGFFIMRRAIDYPPLPVIQNFNRENELTQKMVLARLFFVSELQPSDNAKTTFTPLMFTSEKTGLLKGPFFQIQPEQNPMMRIFPYASKTVAALVEGQMSSYFLTDSAYSIKPGFRPMVNQGQILIISDNQFFNDRRAGGIEENVQFILNAVDYMTGEKELIEIRSKDIKLRPLVDMSDGAKQTLKWLNIILPPGLVVVFGLLRWKRNRMKRKMLEEIYG